MSGQPVKTKADQAKFLDEYMENLALEIELNKQNFDANRVYKQTGQLPAVSSMPDNRTVEEKLADVELLKQGIIKDVGKIISPNLAVALVDEIQKSKFNTDNSLLRFFAQRAPEFMKELEKKYKYGLRDINDIVGTVKFIEKYFTEAQDSLASLKDIAGRNPYIESKRADKDSFKTLADELKKVARTLFKINNPFLDDIITKIDQISKVIPSQLWFEQRINDCIRLKSIPGIEDKYPELVDYENFIKEYSYIVSETFPQRDLILSINNGILKALQSSYPIDEKINVIERYINVLTKELDTITPELIERISLIISQIVEIYHHHKKLFEMLSKPAEEPFFSEKVGGEPLVHQGGPTYEEYIKRMGHPSAYDEITRRMGQQGGSETSTTISSLTPEESKEEGSLQESKEGEPETFSDDKYRAIYTDLIGMNADVSDLIDPDEYIDLSPRMKLNATLEAKAVLRQTLEDFEREIGMSGHGIRKHRMKGRGISKPFVARIDRTAGITASPEFVPFGSYLLNRRKIGDGIVALKTASGSNIHGFPNKRISQKLTKVFHKIAGGALPSFEDLGSLDEEEKAYLHKVAKKANLLDRLSIPSPSKDEREKDVHNFEVMKGEIMSGNDNKDLIKKFKLLVLKLKNQELLPKSQADEILADLTSIGY